MMKLIPVGVTRTAAKLILDAKHNSPHIFFGAGIIGTVAGTALACKATLKLEHTLDEIQSDISEVKQKKAKIDDDMKLDLVPAGLTKQDVERAYFKELTSVQFKCALKILRLYGPSILVTSASIAALTGSHVQLTRRNSALTATLALVSKAYEDYRARVREEVGEEVERELFNNVKTVEREVDGKKETVKAIDILGSSPYSRIFDDKSPYWQKSSEINRVFLHCQENYFNERLQLHGYVFLNEVYDALGFGKTKAGQVVGWVKNSREGDSHIDFGIFEAYNIEFLHSHQPSIVLDFNVDGPVTHILEEQ